MRQIAKAVRAAQREFGMLQGIVHSVALRRPEELKGEFVNTSRERLRIAHDISVYSMVAVSRARRR
jgi:enoyl-[acyl-carrier protein] reductase I